MVTFLSTVHSGAANQRGEVASKPQIVMDYNNIMGGVCDTVFFAHITQRQTFEWDVLGLSL